MDERWLPGGAIAAIGLLLAAVQVAHAIQQTDIAVAIVVDALNTTDATVSETDRQLLELVIAHAAATLRRIDGGPESHT